MKVKYEVKDLQKYCWWSDSREIEIQYDDDARSIARKIRAHHFSLFSKDPSDTYQLVAAEVDACDCGMAWFQGGGGAFIIQWTGR